MSEKTTLKPKTGNNSTKVTLIEAAIRMVIEIGLDKISIRALMKEAGLSHGAFYSYFDSIEDLQDELVGEGVSQFSHFLSNVFQNTDGRIEILAKNLLDWLVKDQAENYQLFPIMLIELAKPMQAIAAKDGVFIKIEKEIEAICVSNGFIFNDSISPSLLAAIVSSHWLKKSYSSNSNTIRNICENFVSLFRRSDYPHSPIAAWRDRDSQSAYFETIREEAKKIGQSECVKSDDPFARSQLSIQGARVAFVDEGSGREIIFAHHNGASSFMWRNLIEVLRNRNRCLAMDLAGMGDSGGSPSSNYRYFDQFRIFENWIDEVASDSRLDLVGAGFGATMCLDFARIYPSRVRTISYFNPVVVSGSIEDMPEQSRRLNADLRADKASFDWYLSMDEVYLPDIQNGVVRQMAASETHQYRVDVGVRSESRRALLQLQSEVPVDGEPLDFCASLEKLRLFHKQCEIPKLLLRPNPGGHRFLQYQLKFCQNWPNQRIEDIFGIQHIHEDSPTLMANIIEDFLESN